jgi:phenylalanyl-tRNA synthetase alpha subunit
MNDQQQRELLGQVNRASKTLGTEIPEELTVQGQSVDLKRFVFECKRVERVPTKKQEQIAELKTNLQRERLKRKRRIEQADISYEEGKRLVEEIHGIDRAVNALESIDGPGIGEQLRQKQLEDASELLSLLDQARA